MRLRVDMDNEDKLTVDAWWCVEPLLTIEMLQQQLKAAQAVWPELQNYSIVECGNDKVEK